MTRSARAATQRRTPREEARTTSPRRWRPTLGDLIRLGVTWFVLAGVAHVVNEWAHLTTHVASWLAATLRLLGIAARSHADGVTFSNHGLVIIEECTGLSLLAALTAFVLAIPVPAERRLAGIGILCGLALAWNALRLVGVALLMIAAPRIEPFIHDVLWQLVTVGLAVLAAALWARSALERPPGGASRAGEERPRSVLPS